MKCSSLYFWSCSFVKFEQISPLCSEAACSPQNDQTVRSIKWELNYWKLFANLFTLKLLKISSLSKLRCGGILKSLIASKVFFLFLFLFCILSFFLFCIFSFDTLNYFCLRVGILIVFFIRSWFFNFKRKAQRKTFLLSQTFFNCNTQSLEVIHTLYIRITLKPFT